MMTPSISLCMIVKNEAKSLEKCLQSVTSIVNEIIIIDTGSTDDTKLIASHFTSQIYNLEWTQDFAAARNASIAKATSEWILILDADEYLDSGKLPLLKYFLHNHKSKEPTGVILPIYNFVGNLSSGKVSQSKAMRLFTRHPDLSFIRPIHEQLQSSTGSLIELELEMPIYHTGYTAETIEYKQKIKRNEAIYEQIRKHGQFTPYDSFTLGNEYLAQDRYQEALSCYIEAEQFTEYNKSWFPLSIGNRINCLMNLHKYTEAFEQIKLAKYRWSDVCDFYWLEGYLFAQLGMDNEAIKSLHHCIQIAEKKSAQPTYLISPNYGSTLPLQQLYIIYSRLFDSQKAVFYLTKLCYASPNNQTAFLRLIKLIATTTEQSDQLETFIHSMYPNPTPSQLTMILDTYIQLGNKTASKLYWERCNNINIELSHEIILKYSILQKDGALLQQTIAGLPDKHNAIWDIPIYHAALVYPQYESQLLAHLSPEFNIDSANIVSICLELFRTGNYDQYDTFIGRHEEHFEEVANELANIFFADRQYELALDYYSLMLKRGALTCQGYENLARLYIMQDEMAEGIAFAEEALELSPERIDLSMLLLLNMSESSRKLDIKSNLLLRFPGLQHFPVSPL
ncbi:glycosyltransferase [Cohnella sp. WQ 127256]|uniref:tetratricopeptide repeat-containing glycosyltransferase family 2 protein n=1 Tax=Cohnella sp. WQ 127256 TaxID=2938790 RepID=UPI002118264D|nr:glycosyltransferase [Cohnella sp. WQ 127256]